jgi:putative restriction endonuclease
MNTLEQSIRLAAFDWLGEQVRIHGEVLPRNILAEGFLYKGNRISLLGPQGIWKPKIFSDVPISITTTSEGPYNDSFGADGLLSYRYRGNDPNHRDNLGLRRAISESIPLIYFHSIIPGKYLAVWPVYVVGDNSKQLTFTVAVDDAAYIPKGIANSLIHDDDTSSRRRYITAITRRRLHQQGFRERVLYAYRQQCACCRLRHEELLDAAHIIPDSDPEGIPSINNGIALCKLHHAAFDSFLIGITPDYHVQVRSDVLDENDGPMLLHGLKNLSGQKIILPKSSQSFPSVELLEKKFEQFRRAG